jgi:hypothetical protein
MKKLAQAGTYDNNCDEAFPLSPLVSAFSQIPDLDPR